METLHQEISRELEHLLKRIFYERQNYDGLDLEAVEMAVRSSVHQAGAAVLDQLLEYDPPSPEHGQLPCSCSHTFQRAVVRIGTGEPIRIRRRRDLFTPTG